MVNEVCPKCDSAYLLELANAKGTFLVCPNNREALPKRRPKKGAKVEEPATPECGFQKKIGPPAGGPGAGEARSGEDAGGGGERGVSVRKRVDRDGEQKARG